jgi:hypothetical protein
MRPRAERHPRVRFTTRGMMGTVTTVGMMLWLLLNYPVALFVLLLLAPQTLIVAKLMRETDRQGRL